LSSDKWYRPSQDVWCADTRIVSGGYSLRARVGQFGHREWPLRRFVFENEWISVSARLSWQFGNNEKFVVQESSWAHEGTAFDPSSVPRRCIFGHSGSPLTLLPKKRAVQTRRWRWNSSRNFCLSQILFRTEKRNWFPPPTFYRSQSRTCANKKPLREYSKFILIVWDLLLQHKFALSAAFSMEWVSNFHFPKKWFWWFYSSYTRMNAKAINFPENTHQ